MFRHELLRDLQDEGLEATTDRLKGARRADIFRPRLKLNALGAFEYTARHMHQFRDYLWGVRTGKRATHLGPCYRTRQAMKREQKAAKLRENDAAIQQIEAIEKRT